MIETDNREEISLTPAPPDEPADHTDDYSEVVDMLGEMRAHRDPARRAIIRDEVVSHCLPLAENIARRFADRGENFDDLLQVARLGLVNAVDRFDPALGSSFLAFAVPTIMGEVKRHFRDVMWSIRVPRRAKEASLDITRATDDLVQRLGRSPRPSELAEFLGLPVSEVIDGLLARSAYAAVSIDSETGQASSLADRLGHDDPELARVDESVTLRPALDRLSERERRILSLRFVSSMSQSEIAAEIGISQMHVSRLLAKALGTLRASLSVTDDD